MRSLKETRYTSCLRLAACTDIHSKRWSLLFANQIGLDLRQALNSPEGFHPCEDGLRSICWKVCQPFQESFLSLIATGLPTLRAAEPDFLAEETGRLSKRLPVTERPFSQIHRASG